VRAYRLHHVRREALPVGFIGVEECEAWIEAARDQRDACLYLK
jgi:hypothetical protein